MLLNSWLAECKSNLLQALQGSLAGRRRRTRRPNQVACVESLESRTLLSGSDLTQLGVVRNQNWYLDTDGSSASHEIDLVYGLSGDKFVAGNWDGAGSRAGVVRMPGQNGAPHDGLLHWYLDLDGDAAYEQQVGFGLPGDTAVIGDWDGNGTDNVGIVRGPGVNGAPNDGLLHWYFDTNGDPNAELHRAYGFPGDTPVVGHWDQVSTARIGVVRTMPDGFMNWLQDTNGDHLADRSFIFGYAPAGDRPVVGNWDDVGGDNAGVVRPPATGQGNLLTWLLATNDDPTPDISRQYGLVGDVPVAGTWRLPEINVIGIANGQSAPAIDFGSVPIGTTIDRTFVVQNLGTSTLHIGGVGSQLMSGSGPSFTLLDASAGGIAPGQSRQFTIRMDTSRVGSATAQIHVYNNDGNELDYVFPVTGSVYQPLSEISVTVSQNGLTVPVQDGQSNPVSFGTTIIGATAPTLTFTIRNDGNGNLSLGQPTVPAGFQIVGPISATTVAPGGTVTFSVQLNTASASVSAGEIVIATNDADESPFNFPVWGRVTTLALAVQDDIGVVRNQNWYLDTDGSSAAHEIDITYGLPGDLFVAGNWDGQGSKAGVVRLPGQNGAPNDGLLHWYFDLDGDAAYEQHVGFGLPGDTPVIGDWDGNGMDNVGIVRAPGVNGAPNDGLLHWYLDLNGDPSAEMHRAYGFPGDTPVVGHWDQASTAEIGVVRTTAGGFLNWLLDLNGDQYADRSFIFGHAPSGDRPVVGNWDGIGGDNAGVVRPPVAGQGNSTTWLLDTNDDPAPDITRQYGFTGDVPVVGNWRLPEIDVVGITSGQSSPGIDFGSVVVGSPVVERTFTVQNLGTTNLQIAGVSLETVAGSNPTFEILNATPGVLTPGQSRQFTVRMNTSQVGTATVRVHLLNNDGNELDYTFEIKGNVYVPAPEITVTGIADGQAAAIDFGVVPRNAVPPTRTFTVRNTGTATLTLGTVSLPAHFTVTEALAVQLAPGQSDTFTIAMDTSTLGQFSGTVSFINNDADENPFNFTVRGTVGSPVGPEIVVDDVTDGQMTAVDFGTAPRNAPRLTKTFTVRNIGTANLTLGSITLPARFSIVEALSPTLAPGQSGTFTVALNTSVSGTFSGTLSFTNNDSDESPFNFPIRGRVLTTTTAPEIVVDGIVDGQTTPIDLGTVIRYATNPTRTFVVRNTGNDVLILGAISLPSRFAVTEGLSASLAPGQSDTFTIEMKTGTVGRHSGRLSITTNDPDENPFDFMIQGEVLAPAPEIVVDGIADGQTVPVDFGIVAKGAARPTRTFTVRNTGTANLTLGTITLPSRFVLVDGLASSLAPGQSDTFTLALDTSTEGVHAGNFSITNNDADESPFNFALKGQVVTIDSPFGTVGSWQTAQSQGYLIVLKQVTVAGGTGNNQRLYADFLDASGSRVRSNVAIGNHSLFGDQVTARVVALSGGNYAVAWRNTNQTTQGGIHYAVLTRFGSTVGTADRVANISFFAQISLTGLTSDSSTGGFTIFWRDLAASKNWKRTFNSNGTGTSGDIPV